MSRREDAVVAICRAATEHNYGPTIVSYGPAFTGDEVTVELSSWPRMREAAAALRRAGFRVDESMGCTLTARGKVGSET